MFPRSLKPNRLILALLSPGIAFLVLELALEPAAVARALPGLLFWGFLIYAVALAAVSWQRKEVCPPRFQALVAAASLLIVLDQTCKLLVWHLLPLGWEQTLIPWALTLTHAHNLRGSWLVVQFDLLFIGEPVLIATSVLSAILALSLYRYYVERRGQSSLWAAVAMVGFFAGYSSAFFDLAMRGLTVDYLGFAGLVVADLKDFYINVALAAFFAGLVEEWDTARRMSSRQTAAHLGQALALSAREAGALLRRGARGSG